MKLAIIVSQYNEAVTQGLKNGAVSILTEKGINPDQIDTLEAPGAFEIPLIAQTLARTKKYDGIICLGAVVKGDTAHFEFISLGVVMGIQQTALTTDTPITFGIVTTYTEEQALARSANDEHNKGREAALACLDAIETIKLIRLHSI